jgi:hypothetical protein
LLLLLLLLWLPPAILASGQSVLVSCSTLLEASLSGATNAAPAARPARRIARQER